MEKSLNTSVNTKICPKTAQNWKDTDFLEMTTKRQYE